MGQFSLSIQVRAPRTLPSTPADLSIDTGPLYTNIPAAMLNQIGAARSLEQDIAMADGRRIHRWIGHVIDERQGHVGLTPLIFGNRMIFPYESG